MPGFNPMDVTTKRVLKKLGGDKETTEIKWDGNTDGRDSVKYQNVTFYKVSDRILTPEELGKATYTIGDSIGTDELSGAAIHVFDSSELGLPAGLFIGTLWMVANAPLMISGVAFEAGGFAIPSDGTYFAALHQFNMYLQKLSFETIHPIDPKFLPGVCLPVVELTTEPSTEGAELTAEESAMLDKVSDLETPCIVKFPYEGVVAMQVFGVLAGMYTAIMAGRNIILTNADGEWIFALE